MKKYKFNTRLQEAVLIRRAGQQPTIIIDGEEREVKCPVFVGTDTMDIPCLVEKDKKTGNAEYTVVAVSFDDRNEEEKSWICIRPVLIEKAVGFFLENNQMSKIVEDCSNVTSLPVIGRGMPDFQIRNTCIEVIRLMPVSYRSCGLMWLDFIPAIEQIVKYHNEFEKGKRMVLLAVCQHGTSNIQAMPNGKTKEELEKAVSRGIELWIAETKTDPDGIELMSYYDITCNILND